MMSLSAAVSSSGIFTSGNATGNPGQSGAESLEDIIKIFWEKLAGVIVSMTQMLFCLLLASSALFVAIAYSLYISIRVCVTSETDVKGLREDRNGFRPKEKLSFSAIGLLLIYIGSPAAIVFLFVDGIFFQWNLTFASYPYFPHGGIWERR